MAERKKETLSFESFRKKSVAFQVGITFAFFVIVAGIIVTLISLIVFEIVEDLGGILIIISLLVLIAPSGIGLIVYFFIEIMGGIVPNRRRIRRRRKQIREAGLDQLEEGEQAISSEEFEERYNQRLAMRQNSERRRPVIHVVVIYKLQGYALY